MGKVTLGFSDIAAEDLPNHSIVVAILKWMMIL